MFCIVHQKSAAPIFCASDEEGSLYYSHFDEPFDAIMSEREETSGPYISQCKLYRSIICFVFSFFLLHHVHDTNYHAFFWTGQEQPHLDTPEKQLISAPVAYQLQPLRNVPPQVEDKVIWSEWVEDGDYVHCEVDELSVGCVHAGMDDGAKVPDILESPELESYLKDNDFAFHFGVVDELAPLPHIVDESTSQTLGSTIETVGGATTSLWDDFDEPKAASNTFIPYKRATINAKKSSIDPQLLTVENPVTTETQLTELSQNTLADVTGNELHPALKPSRRTITPSTRKATVRKPTQRKPRSKKAIAASKQQRVESAVESVVDSVVESAHESVAVAPESYHSHPDHATWDALTSYLQKENDKESTDVQMSDPLSSLTIPSLNNELSINVPALPTVVAHASSSSDIPEVLTGKKGGGRKGGGNKKAYVRLRRTKALIEQRRGEKAAILAELDVLIAEVQSRAAIEAAAEPVDGPVEFKQGPAIKYDHPSRSVGAIHVTFATKGDFPTYIEAAYLVKVREITAHPTGDMRGRRARDEGTNVIVPNLPAIPEYQCSICYDIFNTSWELKRHKKTHPKHERCPVCSQTFARGTTMRKHMNQFHPDAIKFRCSGCQKTFSNGMFLLKHQKSCPTSMESNTSAYVNPELDQTGDTNASQQRTSNDDDVVMGNTTQDEDEEMVDYHDEIEEEEDKQGMTTKGKQVYRY